MHSRRYVIALSIFVIAAASSACTGGGSTPTAPSSLSSSGGAATGTDGGRRGLVPDVLTSVEGQVAGAPTGSCAAGLSFVVAGTTVTTDASTIFEGACSGIADGIFVEAKGVLQLSGSLAASKVEVSVPGVDEESDDDDAEDADDDHGDHESDDQHDDDGEDDDEDEVEGSISGFAGSCPNVSFIVNGTSVQADGSTHYEDGSCASLGEGVSVEVEGVMTAGVVSGTLLAERIEVKGSGSDEDDEDEDEDDEHETEHEDDEDDEDEHESGSRSGRR